MADVIKFHNVFGKKGSMNPNVTEQTEVFIVELDGPDADPETTIYNHPDCPGIFSLHPVNRKLFVVNYDCSQNKDVPNAYNLNVYYTSRYENDGQTPTPEGLVFIADPIKRPAVIRFDTYRTREQIEVDEDGKRVETTAGEPIYMEEEVSRRLILVQKNVRTVNPIFANEGDFINSDRVKIKGVQYEPKTLWATDIKFSSEMFDQGFLFYQMSFALYHNPKTWIRSVRNVGYHERGEIKTDYMGREYRALKRIRMKDGSTPASPVPLYNLPGVIVGGIEVHGLALREFVQNEQGTLPSITDVQGPQGNWYHIGDVLSPDGALNPELAKEYWERQGTLKFRTRKLLKFQSTLPLR